MSGGIDMPRETVHAIPGAPATVEMIVTAEVVAVIALAVEGGERPEN